MKSEYSRTVNAILAEEHKRICQDRKQVIAQNGKCANCTYFRPNNTFPICAKKGKQVKPYTYCEQWKAGN